MFDLTKPIQTMSSREIAVLVVSTHDSVLKTIRRLIGEGVVFGNETPYTHEQNGQTYSEFRLSFRDTMVVASGYSAEMRAKIIDRWQELEAKAAKPAELSRIDILKLAMESEQARLAAEEKLVEQEPKVQGFDRIANGEGSMCLQSAAKHLQVQPKKFFSWMQERRRIYRRPGGSGYLGYQDQIQTGYLEHKVTTIERSDGSTKVVEQVRVTPKGLAKFAIELGRN